MRIVGPDPGWLRGPALQASRSQDAALRTARAGRGTYEINGRPEAEGTVEARRVRDDRSSGQIGSLTSLASGSIHAQFGG